MEVQNKPQNYLASVSDMMAGLLFVFMILLMGFVYQAMTAKANLEEKAKSLDTVISDYEIAAEANRNLEQELTKISAHNKRMEELLASQEIELQGFHDQQNTVIDRLASESARIRHQILTAIWKRLGDKQLVSIDNESGVLRLGEEYLNFSSGSTVTNSQGNLKEISNVLAEALVCKADNDVEPKAEPELSRSQQEGRSNTHSKNVGGKTVGFLKGLFGSKAPAREVKVVDRTEAPKTIQRPTAKHQCLPYADMIEAMFIEGHTDNVPLGRGLIAKTGLKDNRELSTIRAVHTYNQMLKYAPDLAEFKNEKGVPVISVSGYGADRPVKGHEWKQIKNDPVNRRIDIRIILSPFIATHKVQ